jgi:hypothetical protein
LWLGRLYAKSTFGYASRGIGTTAALELELDKAEDESTAAAGACAMADGRIVRPTIARDKKSVPRVFFMFMSKPIQTPSAKSDLLTMVPLLPEPLCSTSIEVWA